ncbi:MAG: hypothetical protein ABJO09_18130 [Hyphomicrobiales bacterium]
MAAESAKLSLTEKNQLFACTIPSMEAGRVTPMANNLTATRRALEYASGAGVPLGKVAE